MELQDLIKPIQDDLIKVEYILANNIQSDVAIIQEIGDHLQKSRGKRLRPIFLLLTTRLFPSYREERLMVAAAVEMVHIATLIHDDCIDEAEKRRGLPTIYSIWGTQTAVLVGDYIYSSIIKNLVDHQLYDVLGIIAQAVMNATTGELRQTSYAHRFDGNEDEYYVWIYEKTAALIEAVCRIGGIMGNANAEEMQVLTDFGKNAGMAFQIVDDLLDFIGDPPKTGKPVGIDLVEGKVTLPLIHALQQSSTAERKRIIPILQQYQESSENWDRILEFVTEKGGLEYARRRALGFSNTAKDILSYFKSSPIRDMLVAGVDYVVSRNR